MIKQKINRTFADVFGSIRTKPAKLKSKRNYK